MKSYEKIKYYREKRWMTQADLARAIGYKSRSAVCRIEDGTNDISASMIVKIAAALDVPPWVLLDGRNPEEYTEEEKPNVVYKEVLVKEQFRESVRELLDEVQGCSDKEIRRYTAVIRLVKVLDS